MEQSRKDFKNTAIILLVLLLASLVMNIFLYTRHRKEVIVYDTRIDSLVTVRVDLEKELTFTSSELDKYKGLSTKLDSLVNEGNDKIAAQEERIKQLVKKEGNSASINKKLKEELETLRKLKEEYLERIDQLLTENQELKTKNKALDSTITDLNTQKGNLEQKVNTAALLKAEYVVVTPMKKRFNGKYAETSMAKKTNKIQVCLSVLDNKIAQAGEKNVYIVIKAPDGKTMGNKAFGSGSFKKPGGEEVMFTMSKEIKYDNQKQDLCTEYEEQDRIFIAGTYTIEVFIDGNLSATSSYTLR